MNQSRLFTLRMNNKLPVNLVIILCITEVAINIKDKKIISVPNYSYCSSLSFSNWLLWLCHISHAVITVMIQIMEKTKQQYCVSIADPKSSIMDYIQVYLIANQQHHLYSVIFRFWQSGKFRCRMNAVHSLTSCKMLPSGTFWHSESVLGLQQHLGGCYLTK